MRAQEGGHITWIASGSIINGFKQGIAYCTVKHGIEGFVRSISVEMKAFNNYVD